jgi:hypothetical protein
MYAIDEVATPAVGLDLGLVLLVIPDELLLLVTFGLEEETADLVEGKAQTLEQFPRAAGGEGLVEGVEDEGLSLSGGLEAAAGGLLLELLLLGRAQVSGISAITEMIESFDAFFSKRLSHLRRVEESRSSKAATSSTERPSSSHNKAR